MKLGKWNFEYDREATINAYSNVENFCVEQCKCVYCQNFNAVRDEVFNHEFKNILREIGIDPHKEAEVYHIKPINKNHHLYGGWFHFIGRFITSDPVCTNGIEEPIRINDQIEILLSNTPLLVDSAFYNKPVLQLEFKVVTPWAINVKSANEIKI